MSRLSSLETIVVATDFSDAAHRALDYAVRLALHFGAKLHLLHICEEEHFFAGHTSDELITFFKDVDSRRRELMARLEAQVHDAGVSVVVAHRPGTAREGIVAYEVDADAITMGAVGRRQLRHYVDGNTTRRVLRATDRCVLLVPAGAAPSGDGAPFTHILFPTDLGESCSRSVHEASALAHATGARLTLAHVMLLPTVVPTLPGEAPVAIPRAPVEDIEAHLGAELARAAAALGDDRIQTVVEVHADVAEALRDIADRHAVDLIAMPRHNKLNPVERFLFGHVTEKLARIADVPLLTFPPTRVGEGG